mgnify:CR=1 FL=1
MLNRELVDRALDLREAVADVQHWETELRLDPNKAPDAGLRDSVARLHSLAEEVRRVLEDARQQLDFRLAGGSLGKTPEDLSLLKWSNVRDDTALWYARQRIELASKALRSLETRLVALQRSDVAGSDLVVALAGTRLFGSVVAQQILAAAKE